jgi:hypothetical protein
MHQGFRPRWPQGQWSPEISRSKIISRNHKLLALLHSVLYSANVNAFEQHPIIIRIRCPDESLPCLPQDAAAQANELLFIESRLKDYGCTGTAGLGVGDSFFFIEVRDPADLHRTLEGARGEISKLGQLRFTSIWYFEDLEWRPFIRGEGFETERFDLNEYRGELNRVVAEMNRRHRASPYLYVFN